MKKFIHAFTRTESDYEGTLMISITLYDSFMTLYDTVRVTNSN